MLNSFSSDSRYVITPRIKLYHPSAELATLPFLCICKPDQGLKIGIFRAIALMRFRLADCAHSYGTVGTGCHVTFNLAFFDEGGTGRNWTIGPIWCRKFRELLFKLMLGL